MTRLAMTTAHGPGDRAMTDRDDAHSRRAHEAVDQTASNVAAEIGKLFRKVIKSDVAPDVIREWLLLRLTHVLLDQVVDQIHYSFREESLFRLSNALADYRDSDPDALRPFRRPRPSIASPKKEA
jgi:hypothetical protein